MAGMEGGSVPGGVLLFGPPLAGWAFLFLPGHSHDLLLHVLKPLSPRLDRDVKFVDGVGYPPPFLAPALAGPDVFHVVHKSRQRLEGLLHGLPVELWFAVPLAGRLLLGLGLAVVAGLAAVAGVGLAVAPCDVFRCGPVRT